MAAAEAVPYYEVDGSIGSGGGGGGATAWGDITGTLSNQTDLNTALGLKATSASPTFTTKTTHSYATATTVPYFNASKELVSSSVTPTELGYLSGVTSGIQTQLDAKAAALSGTSGRVAYFNSSSTISGDSLFIFDSTNKALRIGVTGVISSTNETFSSRFDAVSGNAAQSNAAGVFQYRNSTNTAFSSFQRGILTTISRTITTNTTDTNDTSAVCSGVTLSASGATYTHSGVVAHYILNAPSLAAGSAAIAQYNGIRVEATTLATGTRKVGVFVGGQSGATNNAHYTDAGGTSFTGDWGCYFGTSNPHYFASAVYIGGTSAHTLNTEKLSVIDSQTSGAFNNGGASVKLTCTGNTASSGSGNLVGVYGILNRTITSSTTDTQGRIAGVIGQIEFTVSGGQTYTHAQTNGCNYFATAGLVAPSGSLAITHFSGFYMSANSVNTGTNKYGLRVGDLSGATNNYSIYTGTGFASVGGPLALRAGDVASAASITAMAPTTTFVRLTGSTATTLHGISAGKDGQMLILRNLTGQNLTIKNASGSASAADQISTATGADVVSTGNSAHIFIYDATSTVWQLVTGDL